MAGSRMEKFGTIYKRVHGLLRSGALKPDDTPMWCQVFEAFPPRDPPLYRQRAPRKEVPKILYPEDIIRAQFYKTYGNPDVVDLRNERVKTTCQRFVEKYIELLQTTDTPKEKLFYATASALKDEGLRLRTVDEVEEIAMASASEWSSPPPRQELHLSVASMFGEKTVQRETEEQDYIIEDDIDSKSKL